MVFSLYLPNIGEHFVGRSDQILEKENGHPTHQTRVLEEQTRYRLQEKSVQSEAGQVLSVAAGGSGWPGL